MSSASSSAQLARQALADRLREIRRDAGLTARALADAAGWDRTKVSKLEHAVTAPTKGDLEVWCDMCGAGEQLSSLVNELHAADSLWLDWRRMERAGLAPAQRSVRDLYERTRVFRVYSSVMIPGLVQTGPYVRAVLTAIRERRGILDDVDEAVAERVDRQHIVHDGDHRFSILLEEGVLRTVVGGPEVMAGQLGHLLAVASLPSMSLGVIPLGVDRSNMWPVEMFNIFDDVQVNVELISGFLTITQPREIEMYVKGFADLAAYAVYGGRARTLITAAIDALG